MEVVVDALVLELGGLDMVLGVAWLSTLGKVMMDWRTLSMQFWQGNKEVKLQGQGSRQGSYLNTFLDDKQSRLVSGGVQDHIQLPPERSQVHHIKLFPTHGAINVRPYRYPHHQKEEIERQVSELLKAGVIRPSMSAYSSPVILVKKKDKSWRMCVDYRALNKATIPDNKSIADHQKHLYQVLSSLSANCFVANHAKSGRGIGAVLMQQRRPIAFFSKALSAGNLEKSVYEKELMALLLGYQFEVKYKPGLENKAADALSRCYDDIELKILVSYPQLVDSKKLLDEVNSDVDIQKMIHEIQQNPTSRPEFYVKQGVLFYNGRLVISPQSPFIPLLLEEFHSTPTGGHSGFLRTYRRLVDTLYWVGMQKCVRNFVRACDVCQRQKYSATTPGGLLQPLLIPNAIWEDLSLDFITGIPKSKGYDAVLVVVDRLSKYSHFILLKHPYTAKSIAELFVKEVVRLHGIPNSLISDRDPIFVSHFWMELFKMQGTKLKMSSSYHPETDGQTEVINRCLESYLRCFASDQPKTWSLWIHWAEFWYNTTYHVSIGKTPFEVVYGRQPPNILRFLSNETKVAAVAMELADRDKALTQLKMHLLRAPEQMASYANKKRRDLSFEAVVDYQVQGDLPKDLEVIDDITVYTELVVGSRLTVKGVTVHQSLVKWKGKSLDDVTWEDNEFLRGQFLDFSLEDKTYFEEEGVDRDVDQEVGLDMRPKPRVWRVYQRKK
ncbi:hypothetical protein A2U01_0001379, partial [Trifolium medium]|nr:hypothetical protein [Trifolium medium]